jgi:hypothetical protein
MIGAIPKARSAGGERLKLLLLQNAPLALFILVLVVFSLLSDRFSPPRTSSTS